MSNASLEALLGKEHADITYLRQESISLVISKALSETFKHQPVDPVAFFGKYLLNHVNVMALHDKDVKENAKVKARRVSYERELNEIEIQDRKNQEKTEAEEETVRQIFQKMEESEDLNDRLQDLTDLLAKQTKSTGAYIAKLVCPLKPIEDGSDDKAHLDEEAPKVLQYIRATKDHQFMINRVLGPELGRTHEIFTPPVVVEEKLPEEEEEGVIRQEKPPADILTSFKHLYVSEVVREPRMHFQKVPRLGSYLAVPLVYNSCLSDDALEALVADSVAVQIQRDQQTLEKEAWELDQQHKREAAEAQGEHFQGEEKEWPELPLQPLLTSQVKFAVCLDTLGQDREFSDEERRFVLNTVQRFVQYWEFSEQRALHKDCERKIRMMRRDMTEINEVLVRVNEETEKKIEEHALAHAEKYTDEEQKELDLTMNRLSLQAKLFTHQPEWAYYIQSIARFRTLKMPKILQALMYLLGVSRETICEPNSNAFFWKWAKPIFEKDLARLMENYQVLGAKPMVTRKFNQLSFVEHMIADIQIEQVEAYHQGFAKLFKWLKTALAARKQDITRRKAFTKKAKEDREDKIRQSEERKNNRAQYLEDSENKFKEDHKDEIEAFEKYQEEQAKKTGPDYGDEQEEEAKAQPPVLPVWDRNVPSNQFDEENPAIVIPAAIVEDIDNDWILSEEKTQEIITAYWTARGETA